MEILQTLPAEADFTPLAEHQSQTPASFYNGPPVLHLVSRGSTLVARSSDLHTIPAVAQLVGAEETNVSASVNGAAEAEVSIAGVDVWVASDKLVLARPENSKALAIPYTNILLHAVATSGLYLQLSIADSGVGNHDEYDEDGTIEITLNPAPANGSGEGERGVDALYQALSACADLHPDPQDSEDGEGGVAFPSLVMHGDGNSDEPLYQITATAGEGQSGLPPPMPGSGGWITAENVNEYFDENGNWKGQGEAPGLGLGAGTVRTREAENNEDDIDGEDGETKWQRTD